jgi:hypothetical protein
VLEESVVIVSAESVNSPHVDPADEIFLPGERTVVIASEVAL